MRPDRIIARAFQPQWSAPEVMPATPTPPYTPIARRRPLDRGRFGKKRVTIKNTPRIMGVAQGRITKEKNKKKKKKKSSHQSPHHLTSSTPAAISSRTRSRTIQHRDIQQTARHMSWYRQVVTKGSDMVHRLFRWIDRLDHFQGAEQAEQPRPRSALRRSAAARAVWLPQITGPASWFNVSPAPQAQQPVEEPVEQPTEQPTEQPIEEPVEDPVETQLQAIIRARRAEVLARRIAATNKRQEAGSEAPATAGQRRRREEDGVWSPPLKRRKRSAVAPDDLLRSPDRVLARVVWPASDRAHANLAPKTSAYLRQDERRRRRVAAYYDSLHPARSTTRREGAPLPPPPPPPPPPPSPPALVLTPIRAEPLQPVLPSSEQWTMPGAWPSTPAPAEPVEPPVAPRVVRSYGPRPLPRVAVRIETEEELRSTPFAALKAAGEAASTSPQVWFKLQRTAKAVRAQATAKAKSTTAPRAPVPPPVSTSTSTSTSTSDSRSSVILPSGKAAFQDLTSLDTQWESLVAAQMANEGRGRDTVIHEKIPRVRLTRHDLGTILPQRHTHDNPSGWLNDEMVNAYLAGLSIWANETLSQNPPPPGTNATAADPPYATVLPSQWWNNMRSRGHAGVARWATRKGIGGQRFLQADLVLIPIVDGAHWTLLAIRPKDRQVRHFNSFGGNSDQYLGKAKEYLEKEIGAAFVESEWTFRAGDSPVQRNGSDCGMFVCTNAKLIAAGIEPAGQYTEAEMPYLRRRAVAELLHGGFRDEFDLKYLRPKPVGAYARHRQR
ncbi:MAG: hypothetical protein M1814_001930 [Vezdaea aestivalis]|nr:MAG: hypothetical protein M1814_001930 [Vezdaea aestivalis]